MIPSLSSKLAANTREIRREVDPFSSFGEPLSKGQRNRELESLQDPQKGRILSKYKDIHDFFERKADHAFQGYCTAQAR